MSYLIAVTGKGGTGKTTVSALVVQQLMARRCTPALAVDADPNTCLDAALGVTAECTIGRLREEAREIAAKGMAAGASKQRLLELKIAEALVEGDGFDLIAMGRSEGPGCYCYANNVLKASLNQLAAYYPYVVLDNEAGLENLSRRLVQQVNAMVMVTDPSKRGLDTLKRLVTLTDEMGIAYDRLVVVANRLRNVETGREIKRNLDRELGDFLFVGLPQDDEIAERAERGESVIGVSEGNPVVAEIDALVESTAATCTVPSK